ncbi:hypothetical protein EZV62_004341 [Acer yangbiense]|uniref:VQ domain-containing protein n=1 Tax=Acer yangbiense TaxID=1000413 RepID=A0A5C7ILQ8_9ROSI|nr:hypothetical protein EZV62_004341 [Acer yangbiense]
MASTSNTTTAATTAMFHPPTYGSDPANTTFVQADPSTFRTIVQKLTGAPDDPSSPKLPLTLSTRPTTAATAATNLGPKRPTFKLHERRQTAKKLEIKLNSSSSSFNNLYNKQRGSFLVSPVSTLEFIARVSPREEELHAHAGCEEEEEVHPNQNSVDRFVVVVFTYESNFGSNNKRGEQRREKVKKRISGGPPLVQSTAFASFPFSPPDSGRCREAPAENS